MRILIYGINFAPELTGIGKFTGEMAAYLAAKGHEVRMITAPPYYPHWQVVPPYSSTTYRKETWQGVLVYRCPLWVPRLARIRNGGSGYKRMVHLASFALSSLPVAISQIRWRPERVISLAPAVLNAPTAALVARLAGGKSWLHIQDFELDAAIGLRMLPGSRFFQRLMQGVENLLYRSFDRVSTISNRMLNHLWEKGIPQERTKLFPNWVDTHQIFPTSCENPLRQALCLDGNQRIILYAGNMGQKQGLDVVIRAAQLLKNESNLLFLLCGDGAARPQLEKLAENLTNVRFLPLQPIEELNHLLNLATVHVLPQASGAADLVMPSKLSGMLASGHPVVATACKGTELAEVLEPLGKVVQPDNPDALANAILDLSRRPDIQADLARKSRLFVEQTWDKEVILGEFEKELQAI